LVLWRMNPVAPWPTDPSKLLEMNEKMWASIDDLMKMGLLKDFGIFPDGTSGYSIIEGNASNVFSGANTFIPYILSKVHEIIPYEKEKEIVRGLLKAQIAEIKK
jgi:hypothetical protein